jgi:hypothetical protein
MLGCSNNEPQRKGYITCPDGKGGYIYCSKLEHAVPIDSDKCRQLFPDENGVLVEVMCTELNEWRQ